MKYFTFVLNKEEIKILKEIYSSYQVPSNNEHITFFARKDEIDLGLYSSGKLLLKGYNLRPEVKLLKNAFGRRDYEAIGSDEVGTGDVFGPVTVCAAYVSLEDIEFLEDLNVRDSKSVTDKYNKLIDEGYNLNKIKAHLHNQAIISLTDKLPVNSNVPVIVDQFCQPTLYYNYLKEELLVYRDIEFYTKAETVHIAVAAAAIIARYAFLYSLQQLNKKVNTRLLKGANKLVDEQVDTIYEKQGKKALLSVSKKNFKNITRLDL